MLRSVSEANSTTTPATPPTAGRNRMQAIGLMILAVSMFACVDATAKYLVTRAHLPLVQVVWMRFLGQFAMIVLAVGLISLPRLIATRKLGAQLFRSGLLLASTLLNFAALQTLRLDQTLTIQFLAPLMVALAAGPLLGEWVGWRRLLAITTGFIGIVIVIRPGFGTVPTGMLFALGCMLAYTCFMLITRYISAHDPADVTLTYSMLAGVVLMAPFAISGWVWPAARASASPRSRPAQKFLPWRLHRLGQGHQVGRARRGRIGLGPVQHQLRVGPELAHQVVEVGVELFGLQRVQAADQVTGQGHAVHLAVLGQQAFGGEHGGAQRTRLALAHGGGTQVVEHGGAFDAAQRAASRSGTALPISRCTSSLR